MQIILTLIYLQLFMVESNQTSDKEKFGQQPLLRNILAEFAFKQGRLIPPHVNSLNLGVFQEEARQLANECFLDRDNKNLGKLVYVTGKKKVLVSKYCFQANESGVLFLYGSTLDVSKDTAEKERRDNRYLSMIIHTSSNADLSFSSTDLSWLMIADSHPIAGVASLIVGRTKNMLFFRGQNTPQLNDEEAIKKARLWQWQLEERKGQFIKPGMNKEERWQIIEKAQRALVKQICERYDLQFFSGESDKEIVTKQTP